MRTALTRFRDRRVGVLGLARSGLAVARALRAGGADVVAWDDDPAALQRALELGAWPGSIDDLPDLAALVVSPGVPLHHPAPHPLVAAARAEGVPITGDVELFAEVVGERPIVGVTGTNGKSTTTALVHHLLVAAGRPAQLGGNIGRPVFDLVLGGEDETLVLELSSFQLDLVETLACRVAVWLNLTPDHLDRHGSLEAYAAAKKRIFAAQRPTDRAVVGIDDPISAAVAEELARSGRHPIRVSVGRLPADGVGVVRDELFDALDGPARAVARLEGLGALRGAHNQQNLACAYAAVRALGLTPEEAVRGLPSFPGLPHRMEEVGRLGRILFVNDSKATNPDAASKSLAAFERIYWIAGGRAGPGGFASLRPFLGRVEKAFLIGEAAAALEAELGDLVPIERCGTLERALDATLAAVRDVGQDAVVLLAPACKSFDQFESYEHRGDAFRELVHTRIAASRVEASA
ncbi:MAG: UDP-N-acetylmuramoyl-L-alanine--D-glutamate ligase [Geminicoccaceae bacterium]|nr:UDP-N-acetylmuramoyl-L-alanine--D-glutamate ligase [Geminicoccaceae bacterium]